MQPDQQTFVSSLLFNVLTTMLMLFGAALFSSLVYAQPLNCKAPTRLALCQAGFADERAQLQQKRLTAQLVTDAPLKLLVDTEQLWLKRVQQCHSKRCVQQQLQQRLDDFNIYTSLNQSLTQHYLKYDAGQLAFPAVHLKVHQLDKTRIKIEAVAYRNPNNRSETQTLHFLAYSTVAAEQEIQNNEQDCRYFFEFQRAILKLSSEQKDCERFNGIYRLYD